MVYLGGCCIVYTHLGKRPAQALQRAGHIPDGAKATLRHIASAFRKRRLMVSPVGDLLDYLVVRDRIEADPRQNRILFRPDGIRYRRLDRAALQGMKFSFKADGFALETLQVATPDGPLDCTPVVEKPQEEQQAAVFSLEFQR